MGWLVGLACIVAIGAIATRLLAGGGGVAPQIREGRRPWLTEAGLAGGIAAALMLAKGLVDTFFGWRAEMMLAAASGAAAPSLVAELRGAVSGVAPVALCAAIAAPPLLRVMRRRPASWGWLVFLGLTVVVLAVAWLPYATAVGPPLPPAPQGAGRSGLQRLASDAKLPIAQVYLSPSMGLDADVTGGLAPPRMVVGSALLTGPVPQSRAYVGHLMGHYAHADIFIVSLVICGCFGAGLASVALGAAPLARGLGAPTARRPCDIESLPAAALIVVLTLYASGLAAGGYLRWANVRADAYSLDHAREADGLAAILERTWDHDSVDPSPVEEAVFYTHPPLGSRLRQAMAWKTAHPAYSERAAFTVP